MELIFLPNVWSHSWPATGKIQRYLEELVPLNGIKIKPLIVNNF